MMEDEIKGAVHKAAVDALAATQESRSLPGWFLPNVITSVVKQEREWRIFYSIFRAWELEENQSWEVQSDGSRLLVAQDPVKGKMVAIHYDRPESERIELFVVEVDLETMEAVVVVKTELAAVDLEEIHLSTTAELPWPR